MARGSQIDHHVRRLDLRDQSIEARLDRLETKVDELTHWRWQTVSASSGIGGGIGAIVVALSQAAPALAQWLGGS